MTSKKTPKEEFIENGMKYYNFGDLNPGFLQLPENVYDPTKGPIKAIGDVLREYYTTNATPSGTLKGIVLRRNRPISDRTSLPADNFLYPYYSTLGDEVPGTLESYQVYIPEIHAGLPLVKEYVPYDVPSTEHQLINMYPTFVAMNPDTKIASEGDLVYVKFGNIKTFEDPIFIGPVFNRPSPGAHGVKKEPAQSAFRAQGVLPAPLPYDAAALEGASEHALISEQPLALKVPDCSSGDSDGNPYPFSKQSIIEAMNMSGMDNKTERAMFLSQMELESGYWGQYGDPRSLGKEGCRDDAAHPCPPGIQYEGNADLGNTELGDGQAFVGRGFMQLTGRKNYQIYGDILGLDLVNNPDLALEPCNAMKIAIAYWEREVDRSAAQRGDFLEVSSNINCGLDLQNCRPNQLDQRQKLFYKYLDHGEGARYPRRRRRDTVPESAYVNTPASDEAAARKFGNKTGQSLQEIWDIFKEVNASKGLPTTNEAADQAFSQWRLDYQAAHGKWPEGNRSDRYKSLQFLKKPENDPRYN